MAERSIQLATNYKDLSQAAKIKAFAHGGYASEKLDGIWGAIIKEEGAQPVFVSSSKAELIAARRTGVSSEALFLGPGVYIGEWYKEGEAMAGINGKLKRKEEGAADGLEFYVHDFVSLDDFALGESGLTYEARRAQLLDGMGYSADTFHVFSQIKLHQQWFIAKEEQFKALSRKWMNEGGEGGIFKPVEAGWKEGDRSTNVIRIKEMQTWDLEVVRVGEVQEGPNGGLEGSIFVRWKQWGNAELPESYTVEQSIRGMTHKQLKAWADNPYLIVGKIVEVHAMRFTANGMLREPRFKFIREDKDTADV